MTFSQQIKGSTRSLVLGTYVAICYINVARCYNNSIKRKGISFHDFITAKKAGSTRSLVLRTVGSRYSIFFNQMWPFVALFII